ncbi:MAG: hypothetical protein ACWA5A_04530 [Marinibacterium sp.]
MTTKTVLAAAVLACLPAFASAFCGGHIKQQAQSCAAGTVWDADSQKCVAQANS